MAVHDFKSQRLFLNAVLRQGESIETTREQANYLINVLRLRTGAKILVFNGRDGEWAAELQVFGRKKCSLIPETQTRSQPKPSNLIYCFSPLKQARLDYMVQKAVEMGVGVLQPIVTQYTQVRNINEKRLAANAVEAAEQCGILNIPEIRQTISLKEIANLIDENTRLYFCDEEAADASATVGPSIKRAQSMALLIGPEGGFSPEERQFVKALPNVVLLGLGPRILRADTAAIAALAVIQSNFGDWYQKE